MYKSELSVKPGNLVPGYPYTLFLAVHTAVLGKYLIYLSTWVALEEDFCV